MVERHATDQRPKQVHRSSPWWLVAGIGTVCIVVGAILIGRLFESLTVLAWLTAVALMLTGLGELSTARMAARPWWARGVGLIAVAAGLLVASWPGITILVLAVTAGVALVVRGVVAVIDAVTGHADERWTIGMAGLSSTMLGLIALTWPAVTVLVLAVAFGASAVIVGIRQIALAWRLRADPTGATHRAALERRWPRSLRFVAALGVFVVMVAATSISIAVHRSGPDEPSAFYTAPSPLPGGPPGTIIRREVIDGFQPGATTYRVLYLSTGLDGEPTAVSGLIVVPDHGVPAGGRKVLAYTHGTVGVASRCGPSVQGDTWAEFMRSEGLSEFVEAGYVVAATDYEGLGTSGPHPYLVGTAEAMSELDIVRAARSMPEAEAGLDVGIWGHSQGGHAALFTGQLAGAYAPELRVVGVAAGAPVPDLVELFKANLESTIGRILIAMALQSWSEVYASATLDQIVTPAARPAIGKIADNCLYSAVQIVASVPSSLALGLTFLSNPPWETEPWATIVTANNPGQTPIGVPVLLTQGAADVIVVPAATEELQQRMCASGDDVELRLYEGVGHIDGGPYAVPDVADWMAQRFAGAAVSTAGCTGP